MIANQKKKIMEILWKIYWGDQFDENGELLEQNNFSSLSEIECFENYFRPQNQFERIILQLLRFFIKNCSHFEALTFNHFYRHDVFAARRINLRSGIQFNAL